MGDAGCEDNGEGDEGEGQLQEEEGSGGVFRVREGTQNGAKADAHRRDREDEGDELRQPIFDDVGEAREGEARDEARDQAEAAVAGGELEGAKDGGGPLVVFGWCGGV